MISCIYEWPSGEDASSYYLESLLLRGNINRMFSHYQGGKNAISRCGE